VLLPYIDMFISHLRAEKGSAAMTQISYRTDLYQFLAHLAALHELPVQELGKEVITHRAVREYLADMQERGLSRATMARKLAAIRSFVKYLCRELVFDSNPIATVATPKQEKKLPRFLYPREVEMLLEAPDNTDVLGIRDRAMLELLYATGIRVSELVSLDLAHMDNSQSLLRVLGKGNKERVVPVGEQAVNALNRYLLASRPVLIARNRREEKALFLNKFGSRLSGRSIRNIINKYVDEIALNQKVSPHTLRHTFATHLLNGGADLRSVQEMLGHVKLSTTQVYTHVTNDRLKTVHNESFPRR